MWRPLVDVRDMAEAMISALEAPAELVRGEIFNVLHSNYQIRELAMLVAGSVQLLGRNVTLREEPAPAADPRLRVLEREAELDARLHAAPLGRRGRDRHARARSTSATRSALTDPRYYNIRWLELMHEIEPRIQQFGAVL